MFDPENVHKQNVANFCRLCDRQVLDDRFFGKQYICSCGHIVNDPRSHWYRSVERRKTLALFVTGLFILAVSNYIFYWGSFSSEAFVLGVKRLTKNLKYSEIQRLAEIERALGRLDQCEKLYRMLLSLTTTHPEREILTKNLALILMGQGQFLKAKELFLEHFAQGGTDPKIMHHLARTFEKLGDIEHALHWYNKALDGNPRLIETTQALLGVLIQNKKWTEASTVLQKFYSLGEHAETYFLNEKEELEKSLGKNIQRLGHKS